MATAREWLGGARLRTLPAAVAPVLVGTSLIGRDPEWINALLALLVALSLQIGVNFSDDYSDGIRGTDSERIGPKRLVGSGAAPAKAVLSLAIVFFLLAALAGTLLAVRTSPWLILVGALSILTAWAYTGGKNPYGYRALGELSVFLFFGVVAVVGSYFVQSERLIPLAFIASIPVGAQACAILVINNLRDLNKDVLVGKRTLAVKLGEKRTRILYAELILGSNIVAIATSIAKPWTILTIVLLPLSSYLCISVLKGAGGRDLILLLQRTAFFQLLFALLYAAGFLWSA
jgi:1,4-dihydroxy-2-naphthoate octaprenyltransferase